MTKFKTHFNFEKPQMEENNAISETIPGQALTAQEVEKQFTSGINLELFNRHYYDHDETDNFEIINPLRRAGLDSVDIANILDDPRYNTDLLQKQLQETIGTYKAEKAKLEESERLRKNQEREAERKRIIEEYEKAKNPSIKQES